MTYADIQTLFYGLIGDSESSPVWITTDMAKQYANAALQMASATARHLEARSVVLLTAGTQEYAIPDAADSIFRAAYDGQAILPITQSQLRIHDEEWYGKTGTPRFYYLDEINRKIGLYEAPTSDTVYSTFTGEFGVVVDTDDPTDTFSQEFGIIVDASDASVAFSQEAGEIVSVVSSDELEVFYKAAPVLIVDGSSVPDVPAWCAPYILFAMLAKAYAADTDLQDGSLSEFWQNLGLMILMRLRGRASAKINKTWVAKTEGWNRFGRRYDIRYPKNIVEV